MFEREYYWLVERHYRARLLAAEARRVVAEPISFPSVLSMADVWEKCEDVARRVALLCDAELPFDLMGSYDDDHESASAIKPRAFSNLFLALSHVLYYQPDCEAGDMRLFEGTVGLERRFFFDGSDKDFLSRQWPEVPSRKYVKIRKYRIENDPLARLVVLDVSDPSALEESLYSAFYDNFIFKDDLDEEYELYIRQFCRLTLEFASYCGSFCKAMQAWMDEGSATQDGASPSETESEIVARLILYGRAIAAFGLRFGYAQWLESLNSRLRV